MEEERGGHGCADESGAVVERVYSELEDDLGEGSWEGMKEWRDGHALSTDQTLVIPRRPSMGNHVAPTIHTITCQKDGANAKDVHLESCVG